MKKAYRYDDEIIFYFDSFDNKYVAKGGSLAWRLNNPGLLLSHSLHRTGYNAIGAGTLQTKSGEIYEVRNFVYDDAENLYRFFCQSALESTHTLHYKERNIPLSKLQERIKQSLESPCDLYIGAFDQGKIIAQLFFRVAHPDHPWVKHIGEFGMTILKERILGTRHWLGFA